MEQIEAMRAARKKERDIKEMKEFDEMPLQFLKNKLEYQEKRISDLEEIVVSMSAIIKETTGRKVQF
tara:strand:+ start:276 stop:476 length:201 start_codon:yes stop_codon:yes gene_type:complete